MSVKDWTPSQLPRILSGEEFHKFIEIKKKYFYGGWTENLKVESDIWWLCTLLETIAALRHDECVFPQYAALINQLPRTAYALRLLKQQRIAKVSSIESLGTSDLDLLDSHVQCPDSDAVMVVRPYIRLHAGTSPDEVEEFRKAEFSFLVDRQTVLDHVSVEEVLVLPENTALRKMPFVMPEGMPGNIHVSGRVDTLNQADRDPVLGIFAVNGDRLNLVLHPSPYRPEKPLNLTAGLVAARYTSKAAT